MKSYKGGLRAWIRANRVEIDAAIRRAAVSNIGKLNDEERRQWILNDEGLYKLGPKR